MRVQVREMRRRLARFKTVAKLATLTRVTIEIDRIAETITVRPHKRRKVYGPVTLASIAERIVWADVQAELREKKQKKAWKTGR